MKIRLNNLKPVEGRSGKLIRFSVTFVAEFRGEEIEAIQVDGALMDGKRNVYAPSTMFRAGKPAKFIQFHPKVSEAIREALVLTPAMEWLDPVVDEEPREEVGTVEI